MSLIEHVDSCTQWPGSFHLLLLVLDLLDERDFGVLGDLEALSDEVVAEGKIQAHEGRLLLIDLYSGQGDWSKMPVICVHVYTQIVCPT